MKTAALAIVGAFATLVAAQDIAALPSCGQPCATDMLSDEKADELNCAAGDTQCLCTNPNFLFGFRDCSAPNCSMEEAIQIVQFGVELCAAEGIIITDGGSVSPTATDGGAGGSVSTILSTLTSDGEAITTAVGTTSISGAGGSESGSVTDATSGSSVGGVVSTLTTDGTVVTTTLSTMTMAPTTSGSATNSQSPSASDDSSSEDGDGGDSTATDSTATDSTATDGASETSDGGEGGDGEATSTNADDAAMPQRTAAPGLLAAAGLIALLL